MTVLVTGATGFIGQELVHRLIARREAVRILSRDPERMPRDWKGGVQTAIGDITNKATLLRAVEGVDLVYHLAGEIHDARLFEVVNHMGTRNLLEACIENGSIRVLHYSSVGVIGARRGGQYDEQSACHPGNAYEQSKLRGELAALEHCRDRGLPVTIVRPTIVFGRRPKSTEDSFLGWMKAIKRGRFRFIGRGDAVANYVYVEDVAESCIRLARDDSAIGEVYHIADPCSIREFVEQATNVLEMMPPKHLPGWVGYVSAVGLEAVARLTGLTVPLTLSRLRALTSRSVFLGEKLRRKFELPVGWRGGLQRTIESYRADGSL